MPPRTNVRLQDALLDRVEIVANEAASAATLAYSRSIPTIPRDIHDKLNAVADAAASAADAYFRICAVPANLVGRNPLESLSIRSLEMARATQITAEMITAAMADEAPMAAWMRSELNKATEIFRHVNVMARVLLTIPTVVETATETLPDPPAAALEPTEAALLDLPDAEATETDNGNEALAEEPVAEEPTPDAVAAFLAEHPEIDAANHQAVMELATDDPRVDVLIEDALIEAAMHDDPALAEVVAEVEQEIDGDAQAGLDEESEATRLDELEAERDLIDA